MCVGIIKYVILINNLRKIYIIHVKRVSLNGNCLLTNRLVPVFYFACVSDIQSESKH